MHPSCGIGFSPHPSPSHTLVSWGVRLADADETASLKEVRWSQYQLHAGRHGCEHLTVQTGKKAGSP